MSRKRTKKRRLVHPNLRDPKVREAEISRLYAEIVGAKHITAEKDAKVAAPIQR